MLSLGVKMLRVTKVLLMARITPPTPATNPANPYACNSRRRGAICSTRAAASLSRSATSERPNEERRSTLATASTPMNTANATK